MVISRFTPAWKGATVEYIVSAHALGGKHFTRYPIDKEKIENYYDFCMTANGFGAIIIDGGAIEGVLAAYVAPLLFCNELYAQDFVLFVSPGYVHRTKAAKQLVVTYKEWAKSKGAVSINLGITLGVEDKGAAALYKLLGFKHAASVYELGD